MKHGLTTFSILNFILYEKRYIRKIRLNSSESWNLFHQQDKTYHWVIYEARATKPIIHCTHMQKFRVFLKRFRVLNPGNVLVKSTLAPFLAVRNPRFQILSNVPQSCRLWEQKSRDSATAFWSQAQCSFSVRHSKRGNSTGWHPAFCYLWNKVDQHLSRAQSSVRIDFIL